MRALLTVFGVLAALVVPAGVVDSALATPASASVTCKTKQQKQSRVCKLIAKPTKKAPWKFSDTRLPLRASYDGTNLTVVTKTSGACEEGELNFVKATYPVNDSIPVRNQKFDADVVVTDSNGKKRSLLLRGELSKEVLKITISASFKEASSCIIGGSKVSAKRVL